LLIVTTIEVYDIMLIENWHKMKSSLALAANQNLKNQATTR